jgi:Protein of unknown function (DUF2442)
VPNQAAPKENPATGVTPAAPWRIRTVSTLPGYQLLVSFQDGRTGIIDCSAIKISANPGIYAELADPDFFAQVRLELGALTWPNGADLDPGWLYDELAARETWSVPF